VEGIEAEQRIMSAICKPEECILIGVPRYAKSGASVPTSVASPKQLTPIAGNTAPEFQVFLFRNPAVNLIYKLLSPIGTTWRYDAQLKNDPAVANQPPHDLWQFVMTNDNINQRIDLKPAWWKPAASSTLLPLGAFGLCGRSTAKPEYRLVWLDVGTLIQLTATSANAGTLILRCKRIIHGVEEDDVISASQVVLAPAVAGTTGVMIVVSPGYYCFDFSFSATTALSNCNLAFFGTAASVPNVTFHQCMSTYCQNITTWPSVRMTGGSIRYSNTAAVLNLGGSLAIADIPASSAWYDYDSYAAVSKVNGSYVDDVRLGGFARLTVSDEIEDFKMKSHVLVDTLGNITDSFWPIEPTSTFVAMSVAISDVSSRTGFLEQFSAVEFTTTDTSRPTALSDTTPMDWDNSLAKAAHIPSKTCNKIHLAHIGKAIASAARSGVRFVLKNGPIAVDAVSKTMEVAEVLTKLLA
jgi:hypothetical protein